MKYLKHEGFIERRGSCSEKEDLRLCAVCWGRIGAGMFVELRLAVLTALGSSRGVGQLYTVISAFYNGYGDTKMYCSD